MEEAEPAPGRAGWGGGGQRRPGRGWVPQGRLCFQQRGWRHPGLVTPR